MAGARPDIAAGKAYVSLYVKNTAFLRGLRQAKKKMAQFGVDMQTLGRQMAAAGAAMLLPMGLSIKRLAEFDDGMRAVRAVTQSTAAELESMTRVARELGRTTSFTAVEVANLMGALGRAGFKPDQIEEMTGAVLSLARATGTDATISSGIMAATIRQFSLAAGDASRVADGLTAAANKSFNTVEQLGEALSYAGPVAADFNVSLEDTLAILGGLGNVGIQGSNAGTAVRRLLTLTGAEAEKLKEIFGVTFVDAAGDARPLVDVLAEVNEATADLGTAARAAKFNEAFGLLGITGASAIARSTGDIRNLADEIRAANGAAARAAEEMDAGIGGSFRKLMSAAEGVALAVGESLSGAIQKLVDVATEGLGSLTAWIETNKELVTVAAAAGTALIATGSAMFGIGIAAKAAAAGIGVMTSAFIITKGVFGIATTAMAAFKGATTLLATFLQGAFAASVGVSAAALGTMTAAQVASSAAAAPYIITMISSSKATALLAFSAGAATTSIGLLTGAVASSAIAAGTTSAGLITLSGATATSATSAGIASTAFGILSTVMTTTGGIAAGMWAAITGPIAPFVIVAGAAIGAVTAIGAAAAVATFKTINFAGAWDTVKAVLAEAMAVAKDVGAVLMAALASGDYETAARALWIGVRIAFWEGAEGAINAFKYLFVEAWNLTKKFFTEMLAITESTMEAIGHAIMNPLDATGSLGKAFVDLFTKTMSFSVSANADAARKELADLKAQMEAAAEGKDKESETPGAATGPGSSGLSDIEKKKLEIRQIYGRVSAADFLESRGDKDRSSIATTNSAAALALGQGGANRLQQRHLRATEKVTEKLDELDDNLINAVNRLGLHAV